MKATVLSLLTVCTIMLVGCHSYNFTLPENFQYAQRDTPLVRVRFSVNPTQELTGTMATGCLTRLIITCETQSDL